MVTQELKKWRQLRDRINKMDPKQREKFLPSIEAMLDPPEEPILSLPDTIKAIRFLKDRLSSPEGSTPSEFALACELIAWHESVRYERSWYERRNSA